MKPKVEIIKKVLESPCACTCPNNCPPNPKCINCNGTGIYKDYHYYMIVGKTCYDMDSVK